MAAKATTKSDRNGYAVSLSPDNHSGSLRAKSFLQHVGWKATRRETLAATWNESQKMLEVELPGKYLQSETNAGAAKRKITAILDVASITTTR